MYNVENVVEFGHVKCVRAEATPYCLDRVAFLSPDELTPVWRLKCLLFYLKAKKVIGVERVCLKDSLVLFNTDGFLVPQ